MKTVLSFVQLSTVERDFFHIRVRLYGLLSSHSPDDIAKAKAEMASLDSEARSQWTDYTATYIDPFERQYVTGYEKAMPDYIAVRDRVLDLIAAGDVDAAQTLAATEGAEKFKLLEKIW